VDDQRHILYREIAKLKPGQRLIINFTSIYCAPCRKEIPELIEIAEQNKAKVKLIFVASEGYNDIKKTRKGRRFLRLFTDNGRKPKNILFSDIMGSVRRKVKVKATPCTVVVDRNKKVLVRIQGYRESNHDRIVGALD
jgi:thiol-disulfide isomerase/thioredoxin